MKVLVTGHKGYIGTAMVPMLIDDGHEVVGLDSDLYRECTYGAEPFEIESIVKDIRDVELNDVKGFDAIIHLAGLSNDPLGDLNPELTYEINHRASVNLAALAKQAGVLRFLFSSSCSTYGASGDEPIDESAAFNPVTPYGMSKVYVERDVSALADENFHPTFLRNATAYGYSPRLRFDLVLNNLVAWAYTTGNIHLKSDGSPWRPIVHIEDISRAFIVILNAPIDKIHNQAFNVGQTSENYRIKELADIVHQVLPECQLEFAADAGPDKRNYRVNCEKIRSVLPDFQPHWSAKSGAEQLRDVYRDTDLVLDEFEGMKYKRIDHIKYLIKSGKMNSDLRWINQNS